jgi:YVTN family beta-propeller protein
MRAGHRRLTRTRRWCQRGMRAAALSLTLAAGAAGTLATAPAQAAGGYAITATIPAGAYPAQVAFSPDGTHAYVTNVSAGTVSVINTPTNAVTATIGVGRYPYGVAVSPGGTRVPARPVGCYGAGQAGADWSLMAERSTR